MRQRLFRLFEDWIGHLKRNTSKNHSLALLWTISSQFSASLTLFDDDVISILRQLFVVSTISRICSVPGLRVWPSQVLYWSLLWRRGWDWFDAVLEKAALNLWKYASWHCLINTHNSYMLVSNLFLGFANVIGCAWILLTKQVQTPV